MLLFMNILDLVYTDAVLTAGSTESNPLMNFIYMRFGIEGIAFIKIVFLAILGYGLEFLPTLHAFYRRIFYLSVITYGLLSLYHGYWFLGFYKLL